MEILVGGHLDKKTYAICILAWIAVVSGIVVESFEWVIGAIILSIALPIAIRMTISHCLATTESNLDRG